MGLDLSAAAKSDYLAGMLTSPLLRIPVTLCPYLFCGPYLNAIRRIICLVLEPFFLLTDVSSPESHGSLYRPRPPPSTPPHLPHEVLGKRSSLASGGTAADDGVGIRWRPRGEGAWPPDGEAGRMRPRRASRMLRCDTGRRSTERRVSRPVTFVEPRVQRSLSDFFTAGFTGGTRRRRASGWAPRSLSPLHLQRVKQSRSS